MRILDIDMDYFLVHPVAFIPDSSTQRVEDEDCIPWNKNDVIDFLDNNLGLKGKKIKGKIITNHNEALYYWRDLINNGELETPFEVVHVDSHGDLGLGYPSWTFIFDTLLGRLVEERIDIEHYYKYFDVYYKPKIGDYLLYVIAFRWLSKLTYVSNPKCDGDDYVWMILKDWIEPNNKIQLPHNPNIPVINTYTQEEKDKYLSSAIFEPEVDFEIIRTIEGVSYDGDFDYLTFCISPNYTPASADFIFDIIKNYIKE